MPRICQRDISIKPRLLTRGNIFSFALLKVDGGLTTPILYHPRCPLNGEHLDRSRVSGKPLLKRIIDWRRTSIVLINHKQESFLYDMSNSTFLRDFIHNSKHNTRNFLPVEVRSHDKTCISVGWQSPLSSLKYGFVADRISVGVQCQYVERHLFPKVFARFLVGNIVTAINLQAPKIHLRSRGVTKFSPRSTTTTGNTLITNARESITTTVIFTFSK